MNRPQITKPAPTQHLRRLAVFVDEPDHGQYYWVIIESTEDATVWLDIESSEQCYPSWQVAFTAGNEALLHKVSDRHRGPLAPGEDENASPVGGMPIAD